MNLFDELKNEGKLTGSLVVKFQKTYGKLFFRSLELLQNGAVSIHKNIFLPSNLVIWAVQGKSGYYLLYPGIFCQCHNFLLDYIYRKQKFGFCKHLFAQKMAESLNIFKIHEHSDKDYQNWMKQFLP
ncbi:MAG: hypothetical protein K9W44_03060 [Candidatus Lokiarchaeota archaeon]|nr:hypothetical protein [Candidatus Harpocratesius repetitus]